MKKKQWIAGALALALLAGCGETAADPDDMAYQTTDIRRDSQLFTVDGEGVQAEEYLFWLTDRIAMAKYYEYASLADDTAWSETLSDGSNTIETLKDGALETAKLYQVIRNKAAALGVTVTEEQKAELQEQIDGAKEQMGGDEAYQEWLDSQCISREGFETLNQVYYLNMGVREKLRDAGELTVTDADVDAFMEEQGIYAAKHILISTRRVNAEGTAYEDFTDEEKAAALQKAQDLREQLRAAGDSEELFDQLMAQYSEDVRTETGELAYPDGYTYVYAGQMVPEFEEGALALEVGEISEPIATDYGYHIILRLEPDRAQAEEQCSEEYKYSLQVQQWLDEAQVVTTKAYDELDPHDFYVRLQAVIQAHQAAKDILAQESAQPEGSGTPTDSAEPSESPTGE